MAKKRHTSRYHYFSVRRFPITAGAYQSLCSPNFNTGVAVPNCSDSGNNGQISSYVSKFSPSGALLASTYLGGESAGAAYAVAVDGAGRPYVAGTTYPGVFTPAAAYQPKTIGFPTTTGAVVAAYQWCQSCNINGGLQWDAFVSVFDPGLTTLLYSTLYGDDQGTSYNVWLGNTYGTAVTVDASGNFYLAGYTADAYLPVTPTAVQPQITSCGQYYPNESVVNGNCGFVAKFSPLGSSVPTLTYGTYLGHLPGCCSSNYISGIAADAAGDAYVLGYASVATFPTTTGAYQTTCAEYPTVNDVNCSAAFIAKLNPAGTTVLASTYFGGYYAGDKGISDNVASVGGIVLDGSDHVYIAGVAAINLPQVNGFTVTSGSVFPFVSEFNSTLTSLVFSTLINSGGVGQVNVDGLALDPNGNIYLAGSLISGTSVATSGAFQASYGGGNADGWVAKITVSNPTTTTLTAAPTTATTGSAVNLTAKVTESGGGVSVPTGTVTFKDGGTALGTMTLNGTGVADYTASSLAAGTHSITAAYGGDAANSASTSTAASVTISAPLTPTVTITAAPSIVLGASATLTWSSTNATACTASNGWTGSEAVSGTQSVTPTAAGSVSYVLTCTGSGGSASATATLTVTTPAPTVTIAVAPTSITLGNSASLSWSSTNATACTASNGWTGSEAVSGTQSVTPTAAGTVSYVLTCTGTGGSMSATAVLTVTSPVPTVSLSVSPTSITVGGNATLTWSSTNATACTASGAWSGSQATSGTLSVSPTTAATDTYTLACTGAGGTANGTATLSVAAAPGKRGGGAMGPWELVGLSVLGAVAYRRRRVALS